MLCKIVLAIITNWWVFLLLTFSNDNIFLWNNINLPIKHIPYFFNNHPILKERCYNDVNCPYKALLNNVSCWGYEVWCSKENRFHQPSCPESSRQWSRTKDEQFDQFWRMGDFGFVADALKNLMSVCDGDGESSLHCVEHARLCHAHNLYLDLRYARLNERRNRYDEDLFTTGSTIGGNCRLNRDVLDSLGAHKSPLQSWFTEFEHFTASLDHHHHRQCDITIAKPTFVVKLDAVVNLFHHFCDFVNLYLTQHFANSFDHDVVILVWDTSPMRAVDSFAVAWNAFTSNQIRYLPDYDGRRLCLADAIFAFPPRMRFGLYYNMPLVPGCHGSGLVRAFNEQLLHRLAVRRRHHRSSGNEIRVTFLSRETAYRNVLNEGELLDRLGALSQMQVTRIVYNHSMPFLDQLIQTHNTDIFIGMHGAGLTHLLFLPDWAVVIELYHCGDENCYLDLARLRGVKYVTWTKPEKMTKEDEGHHPTLGAHDKFTNYAFDVDEFARLVREAAKHVRSHPEFRKHIRSKDEL